MNNSGPGTGVEGVCASAQAHALQLGWAAGIKDGLEQQAFLAALTPTIQLPDRPGLQVKNVDYTFTCNTACFARGVPFTGTISLTDTIRSRVTLTLK